MDRAVSAARTTFDEGTWSLADPAERIAVVTKFAEIYASRMMELAEVITTEMGSPISFSQLAQTPAPWLMLNSFIAVASEFPWEERRPGTLAPEVLVRHEGVGVVAAIVPWNVPAVRHDVEARTRAALGLLDRHQAVAGDAARRAVRVRAARRSRRAEGRRERDARRSGSR